MKFRILMLFKVTDEMPNFVTFRQAVEPLQYYFSRIIN